VDDLEIPRIGYRSRSQLDQVPELSAFNAIATPV
jgi:hypothetical protein